MSNWSGFSDEDLKHVSSSSQKPHGYQNDKLYDKQVVKSSSLSEPRQKRVQKPVIKSSRAPAAVDRDKLLSEVTTEMPTGAALSQPEIVNTKTGGSQQQMALVSTLAKQEENIDKKITPLAEPCELDETEAFSRELSNVEKFQQRQREIEEANSRRRAMLKQAIDNRKKQTFAEQQKLVKIQRELDVLDSLVSADISLLRDKIEEASRDFLDAHKRYERAEKEFIESKMDLHSKTERKERLTEHLYTIIQDNEERKARRLMELMASLDDTPPPAGVAASNTSSSPPQHLNMSGQQVAAKMTLINSVARPARVVSTGGGGEHTMTASDDITSQLVTNSAETDGKGNNVCNEETTSPPPVTKHGGGDLETVTQQQHTNTEDVDQRKAGSEVEDVKSNGELAGSHVVVMRGTRDDERARQGSREPLMST